MRRRVFVATTAGLGTTLVAGCSAGNGGGDTDEDDGGDSSTATGSFRLLVSDQPADIGDFDSLGVSFEKARLFPGDGDETDTDDGGQATNGTAADEPTADTDPEQEQEDEDDEAAFTEIDLEGATVDLTEVVGEKATRIFDGELPADTYAKVELHATDVAGVVDGEDVAVMIPSEKLQITKPFEVTADEPTSFVFDINVVKRGPNGYNLLPVISESGVAGEDVETEEVDSGDDGDAGTPPDETNTSNSDSDAGN